MTESVRTVSESYCAPDADIILVSKDNHSYAVHKSNLSRSPVFRDMFDISNAGRSGAEGDGAEEVGTERASKRMKLTMGEETLPEIQMEETSTILDAMIPFFYIADEADYDTDHLGTIGEPEQLPSWARFFDKFNLSVGIASLVVYLPTEIAELKAASPSWSEINFLGDALNVFFVASHFKIKHSRQDALRLIVMILTARRSQLDSHKLRKQIIDAAVATFNDTDLSQRLFLKLIERNIKVSSARKEIEDNLFSIRWGDEEEFSCAGRGAIALQ